MKVVVGHKKQNNKKFYMLLTESLTAWLLAAGIVLTAVQALGIEISRFFVLIVTLIPVLILELIPWEVFAEGASLLLVAGVVVLYTDRTEKFYEWSDCIKQLYSRDCRKEPGNFMATVYASKYRNSRKRYDDCGRKYLDCLSG